MVTIITTWIRFEIQIQILYCHVHNNYSEAVIGNEILNSQTPSNNP